MSATRDFLRSTDLPPGELNDPPESAMRLPNGASPAPVAAAA